LRRSPRPARKRIPHRVHAAGHDGAASSARRPMRPH
jgi:hypothetical protein